MSVCLFFRRTHAAYLTLTDCEMKDLVQIPSTSSAAFLSRRYIRQLVRLHERRNIHTTPQPFVPLRLENSCHYPSLPPSL